MKEKKSTSNMLLKVSFILFISFFLTNCGNDDKSKTTTSKAPTSMVAKKMNDSNPMNDIGIGPIKEITLTAIDDKLVATGKIVYEAKCTACHKVDKKYIGPAPTGIMERRSPEWIMNMILNPEEMVKSNPIAKKLFEEFLFVPMANQSLTEEEARAILEYFRTL